MPLWLRANGVESGDIAADMDVLAAVGHKPLVPHEIFDLPIMQLTRLRTEHYHGTIKHVGDLFPDDLSIGIELGVIARICLPDWVQGDAVIRPDTPRQAISMRKIAASLGSSAETTRRHVYSLRDRGFVTLSAKGVALATTPENEAAMQRYFRYVHDGFIQLIEDVRDTCDVPLAVGANRDCSMQEVIARALDILLLPSDTYRLAGISTTAYYVWGALAAVAVRKVTFDPVLSRRYAMSLPPNDLRLDVSLRKMAAVLRISYATAWRQAQVLEKAGLATRLSSERWTVRTHNLKVGNIQDFRELPCLFMLRKIRELTALGLDPATIGTRYIAGPPARADFGPFDS